MARRECWIAIVVAVVGACTRSSPVVVDRNGNGHVEVLCIGDSNTDRGRLVVPKWCELLAAKHPDWSFLNGGIAFARAGGECPLCGGEMLSVGLAFTSPDVVLLALGTNDVVSFRDPPEAAVDALLALRDRATAAAVDTFVATIPPVYTSVKENGDLNQAIDRANALLAQRVPANHLTDFHTNMLKEDFEPDGIHLKQSGQEKRAEAAERVLSGR